MTRAVSVAVGALAAALAAGTADPGRPVCLAMGLALVGVAACSAWASRRFRGTSPPRRWRIVAPVAVGAALVFGRIALGPASAAGGIGDGTSPVAFSGEGRVVSVSAPREGRQSFVLEAQDPPVLLDARAPRYPEVGAGARIAFSGRVRPPAEDGYGRSLVARGIAGSLEIRSLGLVAPDAGPGVALATLRAGADASLRIAVPEPAAGLAAGILLGMRERVSRPVTADFVATGLSHVVAISGWNIAIVIAALGIALRGLTRRPRMLLTLAAVGAYVALVGASPPVVRAALMAATTLAARDLGRATAARAALAWAVTAMLLADPAAVNDQGFRLSSAATAGLIVWGTAVTDRVARLWGGRIPGPIAETIGVSLAAQAATLPLVLVGFGRVSLVSPAVNLAVAPIVAPSMAAGAIALLGGASTALGIPPAIAAAAGLPAWVTLGSIIAIASVGADLPFASATVTAPWDAVLGTATALLLVVVGTSRGRRAAVRLLGLLRFGGARTDTIRTDTIRPGPARQATASLRRGGAAAGLHGTRRPSPPRRGGDRRRRRLAAAALAVAIAGLGVGAARLPDGHPRVEVLDVGQGDAILVTGSRGGRALVDGGPDPDRLVAQLDARVPPWDRRIDLVIVTHPHEDHVGGLAGLLGRYAVRRVVGTGLLGNGPGWEAWSARMTTQGIRQETIGTGDTIRVDDVALHALWPDAGTVSGRATDDGRAVNDTSLVLLGNADGMRFLLAGDAEDAVDPILIARGLPRVALYKVAHHGSRTASSDRLLDALEPAVAVVSAGTGNVYGHPSPATLARLASHHVRTFRTDREGTVTATFEAGRLDVRAEHGVSAAALRYHRSDDRARTRRLRDASPLPRSTAVVHPPRACRRRDRGVAGDPDRLHGRARGRPPRRGGRAPPRRGQARARDGHGRSPGSARRGRRDLARADGDRRARGSRRRTSGHAARDRRSGTRPARGARRGPNRRLRGQARWPAPRDDGGAIRGVGAALPDPRGRRRRRRRRGAHAVGRGSA